MPATLSAYIARRFVVQFFMVFLGIVAIFFVADLIENLRQLTTRANVGFSVVARLVSLRLPNAFPQILPFAALIGGILTYSQLSRSNELIVARAAGISAWQFILPALICMLVIGGVFVGLGNPLAATLYARYDAVMRNEVYGNRAAQATMLPGGLWVRQGDGDGYALLHAAEAARDLSRFGRVQILRFDGRERFVGRIDAPVGELVPGAWALQGALVAAAGEQPGPPETILFPTDLTREKIRSSFSPLETRSVWELPQTIRAMEDSGFDAVLYRVQLQRLLAMPLMLSGMMMIGIGFSLRATRRGGTGWMLVGGIAIGFIAFMFSTFVIALGKSAHLPAEVAAWTPAVCAVIIAVTMILFTEDG